MQCKICGFGMEGSTLELDRGVHSRCLSVKLWKAINYFKKGNSLNSTKKLYPAGVAVRVCDEYLLSRVNKENYKTPKDKKPLAITGSLKDSLNTIGYHSYKHASTVRGQFYMLSEDEIRLRFLEWSRDNDRLQYIPFSVLQNFMYSRGQREPEQMEELEEMGVRRTNRGTGLFITSLGKTIVLSPKEYIDYHRQPKFTLFHILREAQKNEQKG